MVMILHRAAFVDDDASASFVGAGTGLAMSRSSGSGPNRAKGRASTATDTVGDETVGAHPGDIVVGPATVPHRFVNNGSGTLRPIDIHDAAVFSAKWLEG